MQLLVLEIKAEAENVASIKLPRGYEYTITVHLTLAVLQSSLKKRVLGRRLTANMSYDGKLHRCKNLVETR